MIDVGKCVNRRSRSFLARFLAGSSNNVKSNVCSPEKVRFGYNG